LSWALSIPEGLLNNKAALAATLQKNVALEEQLQVISATVVDGMSLDHRVKGDQDAFREVATTVMGLVLREGSHSDRIDVVLDTYEENSIKISERSLRGED